MSTHIVIPGRDGGHRIAYDRDGSGEPVVLIHGTPSHSFIWRKIWPELAEAGYCAYRYDLLGFGASERPADPAVDTSVAAQERLLGSLFDGWGVSDAHLVAHDIGGAVAQRFALSQQSRVRSLTLLDTVSYDSWPSPTWQEIIASGLDELIRDTAAAHRERLIRQLRMVVHNSENMPPDVLAAYTDPISGPIGQASFYQHQVRHYDSRYTQEIAGSLDKLAGVPVQIIWGREDAWQPVSYGRRLAREIPGARLEVLPEAGHFIMEDKPQEVAAAVVRFLDELASGRATG